MAKQPPTPHTSDDELPPHRAARETTPPSESDDDKIQFLSWDAPLVPR